MRALKFSIGGGLFPTLFFLITGCGSGKNEKPAVDSLSSAIIQLEKDAIHFPDSPGLKLQLAGAYEDAGEIDRAINMYDSLLVFDSTNALWYNRKASMYLAKADTVSAISTLKLSLDVQPAQPELLLEIGFLYANMRNDSALAISKFLTGSPDPTMKTNALYLQGLYFTNIGDVAKALAAFDSCINFDYTFIDAHLEKGILLFNQQRYDEALKVFENARKVSNTNADAYFWTGRTYEAMNKKAEAIDFYKKTMGLDDKITEAAERLKKLE